MSKLELKPADELQAEARAKFTPKPGTKRLMVTLSDEHYTILENLAADDDREMGAYLSRWLRQAFTLNQHVQANQAPVNGTQVLEMGKVN